MANWDELAQKSDVNKKPDPIKLNIQYNWQLDNKKFPKISASSQCGYTSCAMTLSAYIPEAKTDQFIELMITSMDLEYANSGKGTRNGAYQKNYEKYMNLMLAPSGLKAVAVPHSGTRDDILKALRKGSPCLASTMLTDHGHYVCIVGYDFDKSSYIVHDPYGLFNFEKHKYEKVTMGAGAYAYYPRDLFDQVMELSSMAATGNKKSGLRFIYIDKK